MKNPLPRRKIPVEVCGPAGKVAGAVASIKILEDLWEEAGCYVFGLYVGAELVATSQGAKRLAEWAWEHGVEMVRYDYNLRASEDEL